MPIESEVFIVDTSCLILLSKIDELSLLNAFERKVYVTRFIQKEFRIDLPPWISVADPKNSQFQKILELDLDKGEASAMALSLELPNAVLLIDDLKARKTADKLNLPISGTFGLILRAKREGIIKEVKPLIRKVKQTNFRFSDQLIKTILKAANEL